MISAVAQVVQRLGPERVRQPALIVPQEGMTGLCAFACPPRVDSRTRPNLT
jgi:hypothetical protein